MTSGYVIAFTLGVFGIACLIGIPLALLYWLFCVKKIKKKIPEDMEEQIQKEKIKSKEVLENRKEEDKERRTREERRERDRRVGKPDKRAELRDRSDEDKEHIEKTRRAGLPGDPESDSNRDKHKGRVQLHKPTAL